LVLLQTEEAPTVLVEPNHRHHLPPAAVEQQQHEQQQQQLLLTPCEIVWDSQVRVALEELSKMHRRRIRAQRSAIPPVQEEEDNDDDGDGSSSRGSGSSSRSPLIDTALRQCYDGSSGNVALTLIGDKGGSLYDQINQDRGFVLQLFHGPPSNKSNNYYDSSNGSSSSTSKAPRAVVSGVMDGHGNLGHYVAEYARHEFLSEIAGILYRAEQQQQQQLQQEKQTATSTTPTVEEHVSRSISDLMVSIDARMPDDIARHGGATASLVVQHNRTLYLTNVGDSQSFLVAAIVGPVDGGDSDKDSKMMKKKKSPNELIHCTVPFATALHKPDSVEERRRLEGAGMWVEVTVPDDDGGAADARVWYRAESGHRYGLAMSRALGDRDAGATAVIAEPTITVLDAEAVRRQVLDAYLASIAVAAREKREECVQVQADGSVRAEESCRPGANAAGGSSDIVTLDMVHLFVVSATDGIMDYLTPEEVGYQLALGLYYESAPSSLDDDDDENGSAARVLSKGQAILHQASARWQEEFRGEYRDDMSIAVAKVM
jgi:Protein phosphatase 2C